MRHTWFLLLAMVLALLAGCDTENTGLPITGDTTGPTITVAGITEGATVTGTVNISASAVDASGVASFTLAIDGTQVATGTAGALTYAWDTAPIATGAHTLVFAAADTKSNNSSTTIHVTKGGGGGTTAFVAGKVLAQNGLDPVINALVYIPQDGNTAGSESVTDNGSAPGDPYFAYGYTTSDGNFNLGGIPLGAQQLIIIKGGFRKYSTINVVAGTNNLGTADTTLPATGGTGGTSARIAVVTGSYDSIEDVLAKMGLGTVDGSGALVQGTETFKLVDGDGSLPDTAAYPDFMTFITTAGALDNYDVLFINCGNDFESDFFTNATAVSTLRTWVQNGGSMYCSDWSYDFAEQLFPQNIDFYGSDSTDGLSTTAETIDDAQDGDSFDNVAATVMDANMRAWLGQPGIDILNNDDTATVIDWLILWSPMNQVASNVKVWVQGPVPVNGTTSVRPLTVTFAEGEGNVLFTSYHTEAIPQTTFSVNDRILQYLFWEVLF